MTATAAGLGTGRQFRLAAGRFPSGVTVVTTVADGEPHGTTVNAFTTVSLSPLMILVVLGATSRLHDKIHRSGMFTATVLGGHQEDDARWFADSARPSGLTGFAGRAWRPATFSGAPVLTEGIAYFDCAVAAAYPAGDHTVFIGAVEDFERISDRPALLFADSRLTAATP